MKDTIDLTPAEGSQLLQDCFAVVVPSKIEGVGTWDQGTMAAVSSNIRQLLKALKEVSPIYRKDKKALFGPSDWYERQARTVDAPQRERELDQAGEEIKTRWVLLDHHRDSTVTVKLNGQAKKGLAVLLLLRLHPGPMYMPGQEKGFSQSVNVGVQEERLWPVAHKLGVARDLEAKLGISKATEVAFKSDDDYAAEDAEKAKKAAPAEAGKDAVAEALS